jgi:hypothetical protein
MEKKDLKQKPTYISEIIDIPKEIDIYQKGDGTKPRLNKIQLVEFDNSWWLVKISYHVRTQAYCYIVMYIDSLGNIKYSHDNIFTLNSKEEEDLIGAFIKNFIIDLKKNK